MATCSPSRSGWSSTNAGEPIARRRRGRRRAGPAYGSRPQPPGPRRRRGIGIDRVIAEAASIEIVAAARRGGPAARSAVRQPRPRRARDRAARRRRTRWSQRTAETQGAAADGVRRGGPRRRCRRHRGAAATSSSRARAPAPVKRESPMYLAAERRHDDRRRARPCVRGERRHRRRRLQDRPRAGRRRGPATARRCSNT